MGVVVEDVTEGVFVGIIEDEFEDAVEGVIEDVFEGAVTRVTNGLGLIWTTGPPNGQNLS